MRAATVAVLTVSWLVLSAVASAQVRTAHPRIYLTDEAADALRPVLTTDPMLHDLRSWMGRRIAAPAAADTMLATSSSYFLVSGAAFLAYLSEEPVVVDEARRYLALLAATAPTSDLLTTRNRLLALAIGYDWLYGFLGATERTNAVNQIVAHVNSLASYLNDPNYVSGPSRWANVTSLAGCIAVSHDDARLDATLADILDNWRNGYNPVLEAVGADGGHPMAWYYGPAYSGVEAYWMWRTATDGAESWNETYLHDVAFFSIYAANGSYHLPVVEDSSSEDFPEGTRDQIALGSGVYGNGYAESFWSDLEAAHPSSAPFTIARLLTRGGAATPMPISSLPLTRFFAGAGFLVTRDDWNRTAATTIVLKASPFYSQGHHQRDEGHFVIDYRGPLLVEGGYYDHTTATEHYRNFYTRTVAHNALLVHWDEEPTVGSFSNDGGQRERISEPHDVTQLASPTHALHGMVGHADVGACVWARADLGDTYDPGKLTSYTRDLLEVRRPGGAAHPAIYVLDRTVLPVARPSSVLWQLGQAPTIGAHRIDAHNADGAQLRIDVLRPTSPRFEAFSESTIWSAGGTDHPPDVVAAWPYWGRVEVSPATSELAPTWSTLLRVGDEALATDTVDPMDVGGDDWVGARLGSSLFAIASNTTTELVLPAGAALVDGCIAGLAPGADIVVSVTGGPSLTLRASADGVAIVVPAGAVPDAGSPDVDAGPLSRRDAAAGADAGAAPPMSSSCGCRAGGSRTAPFAMLGLALLWLARRRRHTALAALVLANVWSFAGIASAQSTYYVASSGDDHAAGTTQTTAWQTFVPLATTTLHAGDAIRLRSGERFVGPITVTASGTSTMPITIGAYGTGAAPIVTGLSDLGGWTSSGTNLYDAVLARRPRVVVVGSALVPIGRYPRVTDTNGGYLTYESHGADRASVTDADLPASPSWVGADIVMRPQRWMLDRSVVTTQVGPVLSFAAIASSWSGTGGGYFLQNHRATLTHQGDWSHQSGHLTIFSASSPTSVRASTIEHLVVLDGRSFVVIDGLALEGANGDAISADTASGITVRNTEIYWAGLRALYQRNRSAGPSDLLSFEDCEVHDVLSGGIEVYSPENDGVQVLRSTFTDTAMIAGMGDTQDTSYTAIRVTVRRNAHIAENVVRRTGGPGIAFYGNDIVIEHNVVDRFCEMRDDNGGIYTWRAGHPASTPPTGRVLRENIVGHSVGARYGAGTSVGGDVEGIYLDNNSTGVAVTGNTVYSVAGSGYYGNSNQDVIATDNTFFDDLRGVGLTRYVDDGSNPTNGGQDLLRITIRDNVFFPTTPDQDYFSYADRGLSFPAPATVEQRMAAIASMGGTWDGNFVSPISVPMIDLTIIPDSGGRVTYPPTWSWATWRARTGYDASSTLVPLPPAWNVDGEGAVLATLAFEAAADVTGANMSFSPSAAAVTRDGPDLSTGAASLRVVATSNVYLYGRMHSTSVAGMYRFRVRTRNTDGMGTVTLGLRDAAGSAWVSDTIVRMLDSTTTEHEVIVTLPVGSPAATWCVLLGLVSGETYIDDLEVQAVTATPNEYVRFEVNETGSARTITLDDADYRDARGAMHIGSMTLAPWRSVVLMRVGPPTIVPDAGIDVDASSTNDGGMGTSDGSSLRDGALADGGQPPLSPGGCGCASVGRGGSALGAFGWLVALVLGRRRRSR